MAQVGRQVGQAGVDIGSAAIPIDQRGDGKGMTQIMQVRAPDSSDSDASLGTQAVERGLDGGIDESLAGHGDEKTIHHRQRKMFCSLGGVGANWTATVFSDSGPS